MSTPSERQAAFNTAYVQMRMKLNEIAMILDSMAAVFPDLAIVVPAPSPHLRTDIKELQGALGNVSRRTVSHARARSVSMMTKRDKGRGKRRATPRDGDGPKWIGDPRKAYRRSSTSPEGLKVSSGARRIWEVLDQPRTGPELSKLTGMKRKQVEKMFGELRKLGLLETIDLREGRIHTAGGD